MGYQEKRVTILFGAELAFYAVYFWSLHHMHLHLRDTLWLITGLIVLQVLLHVTLALTTQPEHRDERDRAIENRAYRAGYVAMTLSLVVIIAIIAHSIGFQGPLSAMSIVNTLFFVLAIAELSKLATQMALYRRTA